MGSPWSSAEFLAGAVRYVRVSLACVEPDLLPRPTPCAAWDLAALLEHLGDSFAAIHEGIAGASVGRRPVPPAGAPGLIATVRDRAGRLEAACAVAARQDQPAAPVTLADRRLAQGTAGGRRRRGAGRARVGRCAGLRVPPADPARPGRRNPGRRAGGGHRRDPGRPLRPAGDRVTAGEPG